jgi:hypothetical protein
MKTVRQNTFKVMKELEDEKRATRLERHLQALKDQNQEWKTETPLAAPPAQPKPHQKMFIEEDSPLKIAETLEGRAQSTIAVLNRTNLEAFSPKTAKA